MERRLYDAAVEGNVSSLLNLLQEDELLLDKFITGHYPETPLHVASMVGHVEFVDQLLNRKPELAKELDSRSSSPLHLAAAKGHLDIVKKLLQVNPDMCLICDLDGMNPVHIAAIKGHLHVLKELVDARPWAARMLMKEGETILHACVRYNQLEAMKCLVEKGADHEFINCKNYDGNTILLLAIAAKRSEGINFLISSTAVDLSCQNKNGFKALDHLSQRDDKNKDGHVNKDADWVERKRNALMTVASLLATMAFQAGVEPPDGIKKIHILYAFFIVSNTVGFLTSLSIILLLVSGLPLKQKTFTWILIVITWVAISAMAVAYLIAIEFLTYSDKSKGTQILGRFAWIGLILLIVFGHVSRQVIKLKNGKLVHSPRARA